MHTNIQCDIKRTVCAASEDTYQTRDPKALNYAGLNLKENYLTHFEQNNYSAVSCAHLKPHHEGITGSMCWGKGPK